MMEAEDKSSKMDSDSENEIDTESPHSIALRHFKKLPIFVVDYHNHVLEFIHRCIGSRHLPIVGTMLIHFDSHPDMVISQEILAKDTYQKAAMLEQTSIESWIMPLCFTGVIDRIVWIKNVWCNQLPIGKHNFRIGENMGKLFVDFAVPYFLAEGNYCPTEKLTNSRPIELFVINFTDLVNDDGTDQQQSVSPPFDFFKKSSEKDAKQQPYVLDIDLDFFSVNNPFLTLYEKSNCYEQLGKIFGFDEHEMETLGAEVINQKRTEKLNALREIFEYLEDNSNLEGYDKSIDAGTVELLKTLIDSVKTNYEEEDINWMIIYDAGCTADCGGLPQHKSSDVELEQQYKTFRCFLRKLPYPPIAVTMARSAEDNYCPAEQVNDIQDEILRCLTGIRDTSVVCDYLDDDYNMMKL